MKIEKINYRDYKSLPAQLFELPEGLSTADLKNLLHTMMRIRAFEEKLADLVIAKKVTTPCHLYTGQEAVATGVCTALNQNDYLFGTHRSHGHFLAKGGDLKLAMAEIFCKSTGCSKGRGGSMHLCSPDHGILGTSSIVAGSLGIAAGTALAEKIKGTSRLTVVFHGDGVPEEGIWHEAANISNLELLPILFICENNLYCTHLGLDQRRKKDNILEVAKAHGFYCQEVDGNNVLAVYSAAREAETRIRAGKGPCYIECRTYRWRGHVGPNDDLNVGLRDKEEVKAWKTRCPVLNFSNFLVQKGICSEIDILDLERSAKDEVEDAVAFAEASPYPEVSDLLKNVYKEN